MSILGSFFGDKNLENIEKSIDGIFKDIGGTRSSRQETQSDLNTSAMDLFSDSDDINKILESVTIPPDRAMRYQTYEEIVRTAPFIKRMLRVYQPYILQKNPVTNRCYMIKPMSELSEHVAEDKEQFNSAKSRITQFVEYFDFVRLLKNRITPNTILYGDCFVEIINKVEEEKKLDLNKLVALNESDLLKHEGELRQKNNNVHQYLDYHISRLAENCVIVDNSPEQDSSSENPKSFDDLLLKVHRPHQIIILETEHGTRLGYLEIMREDLTRTHNIAQSLSNIVGRLTQSQAMGRSLQQEDIVDKLVVGILKKVLSKSGHTDVDRTLRELNPDIYDFIKNIAIERGLQHKINKLHNLKVRFIRADRMQQFSLPLTTDYLPYGTSILDPIILPAKLYILSQLGNVITKLSRAPAIRKWTIEQGTSQMSGQLIQRLKRELNNSRITVEDLGSWKSIPKILSDYKDLYLLQKQGNRSLDVEVSSLGDPSVKVQDLQDARSELIALSGIPAPYLGYNEVIELREQLVHSNVTFATEIADVQENFNDAIKGLTDKIFYLIDGDKNKSPNQHARMILTPPVVLMLQLIEMTISSISNILATFQNLDMDYDPYYFLEQYIPYVNWTEFREAAQKRKLQNQTRDNIGGGEEEDEGPGGFGRM